MAAATSETSPKNLLDGLATLNDPKLTAYFGENVLDAGMTIFLMNEFDEMINKRIVVRQDQWMRHFKYDVYSHKSVVQTMNKLGRAQTRRFTPKSHIRGIKYHNADPRNHINTRQTRISP